VEGREDWDELEYLSGDHPSYTRVYKTIRRACAEQQEIIEAGRDMSSQELTDIQVVLNRELESILEPQVDPRPHDSGYLWFSGSLIGHGYLAVCNCDPSSLLIQIFRHQGSLFIIVSCVHAEESR
jgi:hypothetical protein